MALDITILPLSRIGGQDQPSLPGLMAAVPPRKAARGRQQDRLVVYLLFGSEAALSTGDCVQAASRAAITFYETPGTLTAALRTAARSINEYLYSRNQARTAPGQYTLGMLALAAIRESQVTMLSSGPMHAFVIGKRGIDHISDPLSGRGLGMSETFPYHFAQLALQLDDRLILCSKPPASWASALKDSSVTSLEFTQRRLMAAAPDDVNAVLIQATEGDGVITVRRPSTEARGSAQRIAPSAPRPERAGDPQVPGEGAEDVEESARAAQAGPTLTATDTMAEPQADLGGPSAYGIAPEAEPELPEDVPQPEAFPSTTASLSAGDAAQLGSADGSAAQRSRARRRDAARSVISAVNVSRKATEKVGQGIGSFLPRLLPVSGPISPSFLSPAMMFIAVLVPLVVVTVASAVYFRYGRSVQYEQYLVQAQDAKAQAVGLTDPSAQREAWQRELFYLDRAESYNQTADTQTLRTEAQGALDKLLGIVRLQFQPVLSSGLGVRIGRLAASDTALYLLDAERGAILHVALSNNGFQLDNGFNCAPGTYGDYTVGPMVDLVALPEVNALNATVIGADAAGNLLYCAPGQVAQAAPLPPPDTNWGRLKAFTVDSGDLYALDLQAHAVWVYAGKDSTFLDRPYFFFGAQIPELEDAIDLAVSADDLYVLHSDGRISTCSYSRNEAVPTRCVDPAALVNPFPAYRDLDIFSEAHFTQMMFSPAPDSALALLDADGQGVFRFAPRSLELQSQLRPLPGRANPLPQGQVTAMAISPSHVVYFVLGDRLYFATEAP